MHELLLAGNIRRSCFYNTGSFARYIWTWAFFTWMCCQLPDLISLLVASTVFFNNSRRHFWEDWIYVSCKVTPRLSVESANGFGNAFMNWRLFLSFYSLPLYIWDMQMKPRSSTQRVSIKLVLEKSSASVHLRRSDLGRNRQPWRKNQRPATLTCYSASPEAPSVSTETGSR